MKKVSPIFMPVWWNGIHSGLRNRGESMRVQVSPQVLCAYIRIGIGAALRMQSGKPVEVRVLLRTLIFPRSAIGRGNRFKPYQVLVRIQLHLSRFFSRFFPTWMTNPIKETF